MSLITQFSGWQKQETCAIAGSHKGCIICAETASTCLKQRGQADTNDPVQPPYLIKFRLSSTVHFIWTQSWRIQNMREGTVGKQLDTWTQPPIISLEQRVKSKWLLMGLTGPRRFLEPDLWGRPENGQTQSQARKTDWKVSLSHFLHLKKKNSHSKSPHQPKTHSWTHNSTVTT